MALVNYFIRLSAKIVLLTIFISCVSIFEAFAQNSDLSLKPITSIRCNEFTFDATGSHDPDNEDIEFFWDFGDGFTSSQPVTNHTYRKSGDYKVTLSITDNSGLECSTALASQLVRVNIPPYAVFSAPDSVCVNQSFLLDASGSYDDSKERLSYKWDFGDGTTAGQERITKTYSKGGDYKISLTVDDNSGTVCHAKEFDKTLHVNAPPVAEIGKDVILKCVQDQDNNSIDFDATASTDVNNDYLTYLWDFGDGFSGEGDKVSHTYSSLGNYDVKLIVKDNTDLGCGTAVDFVTVRINKAPIADAGADTVSCSGKEIVFDGTRSHVYKRGTASAKWIFGDGNTASGMKVAHRYEKPGQYQASLTLENELNAMCPPSKDTRIITINSTPTVSIKSGTSVCLGNKIQFDASSAVDADGDDLEYYWSFGDGNILKAGPKVSHEYKQGGNYRVTVIVDDGKGTTCSTATADADILVNTPPKADAGPNLACCIGKNTEFNSSASADPDGDELTYLWEFGDGTSSTGEIVNHAYKKAGTYNVTLTVNDNSGTSCSKSTSGFVAEVNSSPVPVINVR